jgi:hypothetical protein
LRKRGILMEPTTMSLFEREIRAQVDAARLAVAEAERRDDLTLADAARAHLQSLVDLAARNGVSVADETPVVVAQATPSIDADGTGPELATA